MAQIIIDIPDTHATQIRDAFAATFGWTVESGLTKTQFAKQEVARYVKQVYQAYEVDQAAIAARDAKIVETDAVIIT